MSNNEINELRLELSKLRKDVKTIKKHYKKIIKNNIISDNDLDYEEYILNKYEVINKKHKTSNETLIEDYDLKKYNNPRLEYFYLQTLDIHDYKQNCLYDDDNDEFDNFEDYNDYRYDGDNKILITDIYMSDEEFDYCDKIIDIIYSMSKLQIYTLFELHNIFCLNKYMSRSPRRIKLLEKYRIVRNQILYRTRVKPFFKFLNYIPIINYDLDEKNTVSLMKSITPFIEITCQEGDDDKIQYKYGLTVRDPNKKYYMICYLKQQNGSYIYMCKTQEDKILVLSDMTVNPQDLIFNEPTIKVCEYYCNPDFHKLDDFIHFKGYKTDLNIEKIDNSNCDKNIFDDLISAIHYALVMRNTMPAEQQNIKSIRPIGDDIEISDDDELLAKLYGTETPITFSATISDNPHDDYIDDSDSDPELEDNTDNDFIGIGITYTGIHLGDSVVEDNDYTHLVLE